MVDLRHWLLPVAAWLIAVSGYPPAPMRWSATAAIRSRRSCCRTCSCMRRPPGVAMLGVQLAVIAFLAAMLAVAFKPDRERAFAQSAGGARGRVAGAAGRVFLAWMLGYGVELLWTVSGTIRSTCRRRRRAATSRPTAPRAGHAAARHRGQPRSQVALWRADRAVRRTPPIRCATCRCRAA